MGVLLNGEAAGAAHEVWHVDVDEIERHVLLQRWCRPSGPKGLAVAVGSLFRFRICKQIVEQTHKGPVSLATSLCALSTTAALSHDVSILHWMYSGYTSVLKDHNMSNVPQPRNDEASSFHGRVYASFSLLNNVYCVPVDEVCLNGRTRIPKLRHLAPIC